VTRLTAAAALATAAAVTSAIVGFEVSAAADAAVRAEVDVAVAGGAYPLDVRRIRIVDDLSPGASYRLPTIGLRNHRGVRTAYRIVVSGAAPHAARRPPRPWLRYVPAVVVIDPGRSRPIRLRLEVPRDAEPGWYAAVLGARPGGPRGARLTFRIEPSGSAGASLRHVANLPMWAVIPALAGALLAVVVPWCGMGPAAAARRRTWRS